MSRFASENDRVLSLLADASSTGIDARAADELAILLGPDLAAEIEATELAAAALDLALLEQSGGTGSLEAMPAAVSASIAAEATKYVGTAANTDSLRLARREDDARLGPMPANRAANSVGSAITPGGMAWAGWLAAAAGIVLAASAWLPRMSTVAPGSGGGGAGTLAQRTEITPDAPTTLAGGRTPRIASKTTGQAADSVPVGAPPGTPTLEQLRARAGTIEIAWKPLPDETCKEKCSGRVVWNNELQQGFMTFKGLAANDPAKFQYQLWVFDSAQKHPIDGGVFDIAAARAGDDGEVLVPIVAKIRVDSPQAFAVTIEKPGGVVVSDQTRIATLAPVTKG